MFEDDGDDGHFGPLPDPSSRAWRHPSELGASANVGLSPIETTRSPGAAGTLLVWPTAMIGTCVLVAAALFAVAVGGAEVKLTPDERAQAGSRLPTSLPSPRTAGQTEPASGSNPEGPGEATDSDQGIDLRQQLAAAAAGLGPQELLADTANGLERLRGDITLAAGWDAAWPIYRTARSEEAQLATITFIGTPDLLAVTSRTALGEATIVYASSPAGPRRFNLVAADSMSDVALLAPEPDDAPTYDAAQPLPSEATVEYANAVCAAHMTGPASDDANDGCGIVSNIDLNASTLDDVRLFGLYQTTIPFRPNLAGAPLLGPKGEIVGMVVQTDSFLTTVMPIADLRAVASQLHAHGVVERGWLGIEAEEVEPAGAVVKTVVPAGPADNVLLPGDHIVAIDGVAITDADHLTATIQSSKPGSLLDVTAKRDDSMVAVALTAGRLAQDAAG